MTWWASRGSRSEFLANRVTPSAEALPTTTIVSHIGSYLSSLLKHPLVRPFGPAMLTGQRDPIGALVAAFAVPFPPIPTLVTDLTVPGATILDDALPAKRVPVHLAAPLAGIVIEQRPERNALTPARQLVFLCQLPLRQLSERLDILDGAKRKGVNVHAV
jgi:hypothetical protein